MIISSGVGTNHMIAGIGRTSVTIAGIATVYNATGIVSATAFYGDGSNLTGISAGGFSPDDQGNLYAGTDAGASSDADTCFNIAIGLVLVNVQIQVILTFIWVIVQVKMVMR